MVCQGKRKEIRRIRRASAAGAVKDRGPLRGVLRTSQVTAPMGRLFQSKEDEPEHAILMTDEEP